MAEDSDKTEEPTEHKLQEARKKGQIFKSQEIISTLLLLATAGIIGALGSWMVSEIGEYTRRVYQLFPAFSIPGQSLEERNVWLDMLQALILFAKVLVPILAAAFLMALVANWAQIKWVFSVEPLSPKLSKISPIEGFKRIFSMRSLMELAKQLAKLIVIGYVCFKVTSNSIGDLSNAVGWDLTHTLHFVRQLVVRIVEYVLAAMAGIAVIDYIFQRQQFMKQMRMSIQELKDEYKDTEGNPQVKAKIRQLMRQGAQSAMMEEVPNSSAVITNPTHLAVAVKYQQGVTEAPMVVAKGEHLIAVQIKVMAEDHEVPIVENVELARALFSACEVGQTIPVEFYQAVAEILAYLYKLKRKKELMKQRRARRLAASARGA